MDVEHLAIDGSMVRIQADADLSAPVTATGWAVVPSLMRAHPFTISSSGYSAIVERTLRSDFEQIKIGNVEEFSIKDGTLRVAQVELPTATGGTRQLTVAAWEGRGGCLSTSIVGHERDALVEVFDTLQFSERRNGLQIDSPVVARPREPMVIKEVPELGVINIQPALASTLEHVPRTRGLATASGELFRLREGSDALMYVNDSVVARIDPLKTGGERAMLAVVETLRVDWQPVASR